MKKTFFYSLCLSLITIKLLVNSVMAQEFVAKDGKIFIPVEDITTTVSYYTFDDVKIFVVKNSSGGIVTHKDACQACGPVGFVQNGTAMKCNGCGLQYEIDDLGVDKAGSCWPYYVSNRTEDNSLVLDQMELGVDLKPTPVFSAKYNNNNYMSVINVAGLSSVVYVSKADSYNLSVYSVSGKLISEVRKTFGQAGQYSVETFKNKLAKGEYFITLESSDQIVAKKIIVK